MSRRFFRVLARLNKRLLPKLGAGGLDRITPAKKALIAWRYYVTCRALD
ncbi:MAG: SsrA-binding protein [Flavobacteriales bacterium]|jgi:hypothetical protein|nr:SsrA-binding protein [Flavobacteriales bacterium]